MASQLAAAARATTSSILAGIHPARLLRHRAVGKPTQITQQCLARHITAKRRKPWSARRFTLPGGRSNAPNPRTAGHLRFLAALRALLARRCFRCKANCQTPESIRAPAIYSFHGGRFLPPLPRKSQLGPAQSPLHSRQIVDRLARQRRLRRRNPLRHVGAPHHRQRLERRSANQRGPSTDPLRSLCSHPPSDLHGPAARHARHRPSSSANIAACSPFAMFLVGFTRKARKEESFLSAEFGPAFEEHRRHTGFFLPRFS